MALMMIKVNLWEVEGMTPDQELQFRRTECLRVYVPVVTPVVVVVIVVYNQTSPPAQSFSRVTHSVCAMNRKASQV